MRREKSNRHTGWLAYQKRPPTRMLALLAVVAAAPRQRGSAALAAAPFHLVHDCVNGCSGHGACFHGLCVCEAGWDGGDCSMRRCPRDCCGNGQCMADGLCACRVGFGPLNMSSPINDCCGRSCPVDCGEADGRGRCDHATGKCACEAGWGGERCGRPLCPSGCTGHGACSPASGRCLCEPGWHGESCEAAVCAHDCGEHGACVDGECLCLPGYTGLACERPRCHDDCSLHGRCELRADGTTDCICDLGWDGRHCERRMCPHRCSHHGQCLANATCACDAGWTGASCDELACPTDPHGLACSQRGTCAHGKCFCEPPVRLHDRSCARSSACSRARRTPRSLRLPRRCKL